MWKTRNITKVLTLMNLTGFNLIKTPLKTFILTTWASEKNMKTSQDTDIHSNPHRKLHSLTMAVSSQYGHNLYDMICDKYMLLILKVFFFHYALNMGIWIEIKKMCHTASCTHKIKKSLGTISMLFRSLSSIICHGLYQIKKSPWP